jgi:tripartite-type tricarboxylate transporter receptor subunit TctC
VGIFLTYPFAIVTSADAPYDTMEELAAHAQENDVVLGHFGAPLPPTKVTLAMAREMGFSYASDAAFDALDCNTLASGDVDVMNTTIQLVKPCIDDIKVLASVTGEPLRLAPEAPTVSDLVPELGLSLWNGLFVHKDTPESVREKIAAVARDTIASERAQTFAAETGAQIYWKGAEESLDQIARDAQTLARIEEMLAE